jgi:hypothetical protein
MQPVRGSAGQEVRAQGGVESVKFLKKNRGKDVERMWKKS